MKRSWKKSLLTAAVLAGVLGMALPMGTHNAYAKANLDQYFDFEAHRGGRDARPENTLYSYTYAIEQGATSIECDMQLAGDGQIVMSHNPILNHEITQDKNGNYIPNGKYDIRKMSVKDIKKYNVGHINPETEYFKLHGLTQVSHDAEIPTLEEVLQLIQKSGDKEILLNIETKSYKDPAEGQAYKNNADPQKFVETFNALIKKYNMEDRVVLQSFDWTTLRLMKKLNPNISTSALWSQQPSWGRGGEYLRPYEEGPSPYLGGLDIDDFKGDPVAAAHAIGADVISPYYQELSQQQVIEAHNWGMKVVPWTVNNERDMAMLYDMGVDGIISDKPWVLRAFLEKRGAKLRPKHPFASQYHLDADHNTIAEEKKAAGGKDAAY